MRIVVVPPSVDGVSRLYVKYGSRFSRENAMKSQIVLFARGWPHFGPPAKSDVGSPTLMGHITTRFSTTTAGGVTLTKGWISRGPLTVHNQVRCRLVDKYICTGVTCRWMLLYIDRHATGTDTGCHRRGVSFPITAKQST